ncbi:junctional adhesion molecule 2A isoform X2 [Brachyhypopomus gauderio]|uniref:junctional adhesion molecule 2A isoform X2 n=1 Tax=Brachyhypopomus gauderio TaxID=698409 RepID=UPI004042EA93
MPLFLFVVLPLLMQSFPVAPVIVTTTRPRVEVQENSDAVLSCEFKTENDQNPRIEWKKKDKDVSFVYFDGTFTGPFAGRAQIDGATVTLRKVTLKDAGEYRCEVSAHLDAIMLGETNVTLKVLVPPHIPSCDIPTSALTGSRVELRCRDQHSIPPAVYTWYKDRRPLVPPRQANANYTVNQHTGVLTFLRVTRADTGLYHCEAKNGVGQPKSCVGKQMDIDDLNVPAVVIGIVAACLAMLVCAVGVCYALRQGYFSRHRGRPHAGYGPPSQDDFKHTQSFML